MIRQIRGKVLALGGTEAIIEVAGFGVAVALAAPLGITLGEEATLACYLAVKQDGMELYGFADPLDRDFFEVLITVPGVGPKTALSILRKAPRESLANALSRKDINYLTRVAGLGKKSAEKLAVMLSEKVSASDAPAEGADIEVFDTLVALGYTEREARKALAGVPENVAGKEARLRAALSGK
jgi:Holliday junction DNA helicase RuvA